MDERRQFCLWLGAALVGCAACAGGQTGDEDAWPPFDPPVGSPSQVLCPVESEPTQSLDLEQPSPDGFSAADLLTLAQGRQQVTLDFGSQAERDGQRRDEGLELRPSEADTSLQVELRYTAGAIRYHAPLPGSGNCPGAITIESELQLRSADGALDERWQVLLQGRSAREAWVRVGARPKTSHDPSEPRLPGAGDNTLQGALQLRADGEPEARLAYLEVELLFSVFGARGWLHGYAQYRDGGSYRIPIATVGETCEFAAGVPLDLDDPAPEGFSGQDVVTRLQALKTSTGRLGDGTSLSLALEFEPPSETACLRPVDLLRLQQGSLTSLLRLRGTLGLADDRGHIDLRWPVQASARAVPDSTTPAIELSIDDHAPQLEPAQLQRELPNTDLSGYDDVGIELALGLPAGGALRGKLTVTGYEAPPARADAPTCSRCGNETELMRLTVGDED